MLKKENLFIIPLIIMMIDGVETVQKYVNEVK